MLLKEVIDAEKSQDRKIKLVPVLNIYDNVPQYAVINYVMDYCWGFKYDYSRY